MANNIPITARVNRGLFSQKKSPVQEPLLSVGVAGVYGNNETRTIPAPSKLMSSPFKQVSKSQSAGAKILEQQSAGGGTKGTTETITVPGGTKTIPGKTHVPNENAWWRSRTPQQKAEHNAKIKNDPQYKPTTIKEPDTNKIIDKPGKEVELRVFHEGDAMASFGRRQIDRAITHTARKTKRAEIDLAKAKAKADGLTGSAKSDFISKAKDAARLKQAETKAKGYGANAQNAVLQSEQSKSYGGTILGTQLDQSKEQIKNASEATAATAADDQMQIAAITKTIPGTYDQSNKNPAGSTSTSTPPVTKAPSSVEPAATDVKAAETPKAESVEKKKPTSQMTEDDTPPDSAAYKKVNSFFVKKSPLKMKYFR